jgi:hypothetical protein
VTNAMVFSGIFCQICFLLCIGLRESLAGLHLGELSVTTNVSVAFISISFTSGDVIWVQELDS